MSEEVKFLIKTGGVPMTLADWMSLPESEAYVGWLAGGLKQPKFSNKEYDMFLNHRAFKIEYCKLLFEHMKRGKSYESFGSRQGILPGMKVRWEKELIWWRLAKELGQMALLEKWEDIGLDLSEGVVNGKAEAWKLNMQSRFRDSWGEKKEVAHAHLHGGKVEVRIGVDGDDPPVMLEDEKFVDVDAEIIQPESE